MIHFKKKALHGISWTAISGLISGGLQGLLLILVARSVTPTEYSIMGIILLIIGFTAIYTDAGLNGAVIYAQNLTKNFFSSLFCLNIFIGVSITFLIIILAPIIASFFKNPSITPYLQISILSIIPISIGKVVESILQRELNFKLISLVEIISITVAFICSLFLLLSAQGIKSLIAFTLIFNTLKSSLLLIFSHKFFKLSFHFSIRDLHKKHIQFGLFQLGERTINLFAERFDQIVIGRLGTPGMLGAYSMAFSMVSQPLSRLNPIIIKVIFPIFSKIQSDNSRLREAFLKLVNVLSIVNSLLLVCFIIFAHEIIFFLLGKDWLSSVPIFQILSIIILIRCAGNPSGMLSLAKGNARIGFYWNLFFLIVTIPLIYFGFIYKQAVGVAIAILVLQVISFYPFYFFYIRKIIGKCFVRFTLSIFTPILISFAIGIVIHLLIKNSTLIFTILKICLFQLLCLISFHYCFNFPRAILPNKSQDSATTTKKP